VDLEKEVEGTRGILSGLGVADGVTPMEWGPGGGQLVGAREQPGGAGGHPGGAGEQASKEDKGETKGEEDGMIQKGSMGGVMERLRGVRVVVDKEGGSLRVAGGVRVEGETGVDVEEWLGGLGDEEVEVVEVVRSGVGESEGDRSVDTVLSLGGGG